jgi:hypothetical protein
MLPKKWEGRVGRVPNKQKGENALYMKKGN